MAESANVHVLNWRESPQRARYLRFAVAFCVAPILPALLEAWLISDLDGFILLFVAGVLYAMQLIFGVPGYLVLREYGQYGLAPHLVVGFASVAIPVLLFALYACFSCLPEGLFQSMQFGLLGLPMGAVFWLVARPDTV